MTPSKPSTSSSAVENAFNWRYATKRFDPTRTIPADAWRTLEESLRLAPSSFGLQPWHFIVITNPDLRKELQTHSWNQPQITEASHLVVIASRRTLDEQTIDTFINSLAQARNQAAADLASYRQMISGFVGHLKETNAIEAWTTKQSYLALGFLLSSSAMLGIDACPLEGIIPAQYNKLLDLENSEYSTRVACALGYRASDDTYAQAAKFRFPRETVLSCRD
ncbi:MAG: nitroreductase family protein [Pseudomonadota bacterium]|jgi:nitroreductase